MSKLKKSDAKYRLVIFLSDSKIKTEIDIVPSDWIYKDEKSGKLKCKFMPPPYDKKKQNKLVDMIKNNDEPETDWPSYYIEVRERASK